MAKSLKDFVAEAKSRIREISAAEAAESVKKNPKTLILDVREPAEWATGHIPGALHVPRGMLEAKADLEYANREPALADRTTAIIIHCASGARSATRATSLAWPSWRESTPTRVFARQPPARSRSRIAAARGDPSPA